MQVQAAGATHTGMVRSNNEDGFLALDRVFAVADGMGGLSAGEVASNLALTTIEEAWHSDRSPKDVGKWVRQANHVVWSYTHRVAESSGAGTTLTVLAIDGSSARIGHVGDTRAYLLRGGALTQVTEDHSRVQRMVRDGLLTPEEAASHPERNVITRAVGIAEEVEPDVVRVGLQDGDRLMLCSDGLAGVVDDDVIREILLRGEGPQDTCDSLIDAALEGGGPDNITTVVVDIEGKVSERPPMSVLAGAAAVAVVVLLAIVVILSNRGPGMPPGPADGPTTISKPPTQTVTPPTALANPVLAAITTVEDSLPVGASPDSAFPELATMTTIPQKRRIDEMRAEIDAWQRAMADVSAVLRDTTASETPAKALDSLEASAADYLKVADTLDQLLASRGKPVPGVATTPPPISQNEILREANTLRKMADREFSTGFGALEEAKSLEAGQTPSALQAPSPSSSPIPPG